MRLSRLRRGFSLRGTKSDTLVGFGVRFTKHEYDIRSRIAFRDRAPKLEKCKFIFYFYMRLKCYYCLRKLTLCRSEMRYVFRDPVSFYESRIRSTKPLTKVEQTRRLG
jgi:hypothetical protein